MSRLKPVLLVEDDRIDAMTVGRALKEMGVANAIVHLANGEDALKYARDKGSLEPCVVLLDLNMPRMGGIEFLKAVRSEGLLKDVPVLVFIGLDDDKDKIEKLNLGIVGYVIKSVDYKRFAETIKVIDRYVTVTTDRSAV